jgi:hypothetical protein
MKIRIFATTILIISMSSMIVACGSDNSSKGSSDTTGPCPSKLTIQTDWFPELEHGGVYQLIGANGTASKDSMSYSGPVQAAYAVGGLQEVEILAKNFDMPNSAVLVNGKADMAFIGVADIIKDSAAIPLVAVAKTLDKDPIMVMWDPTLFNVQKPEDLATTGASFIHFPGLAYIDYFIEKGYITADQSDPSYNGSDAAWVAASGKLLQQGFATNEIYKYENDIPWKDGAPADVSFFTVGQLGYDNYPSSITMLQSHAAELSDCLKLFIPKLAQAWVDYYNDPTPVTDVMIDINNTYDGFWRLSPELNTFGLKLLDELEIGANSPDGTYCSFDEAKVQKLYDILQPIYTAQGVEVTDDATTVYDNSYCAGAPGR